MEMGRLTVLVTGQGTGAERDPGPEQRSDGNETQAWGKDAEAELMWRANEGGS